MFPTFVTSFQDQITAVLINLIGTVTAGVINAFVGAFVSGVLTPFLKDFATALGVGVA